MPTITSIKPQKNNKRVNIYLDNKFAFGLDLENFIKFNLKVEQELAEEDIEKIVKEANWAKTYNNLIKYCMSRPRSEKEIDDWLYRKKIHISLYDKLKKKLVKLDLLDDNKFAKWWIGQRMEFRPRGINALKSELYQKGIDKKIISKAIKEAEINEYELAKRLVEKNKRKWARYDEQKRKEKMYGFLSRKGFSWDVIKEVSG